MSNRIELSHGAGSRASARLVKELFLKYFDNPRLRPLDDGALLELSGRLAVSTDAFVVDPLFFPGGSIGKLAVCGTLNDLAMCGAVPRALSAAFVLEEGLEIDLLERIVADMAAEARAAQVEVVTGDTKVVPRGGADRVFITTTGIGQVIDRVDVSGQNAVPGDQLLLSGPVGDHGATIMALRAGIETGQALFSDCASLAGTVRALLEEIPQVHCLRDPTRGGLTAVTHEIAAASGVGITLQEEQIPVGQATRSVCDILGLDPLIMASEGRFLAVVPEEFSARALELLRRQPGCLGACRIGFVSEQRSGQVVLETTVGGHRILNLADGEPLPRIC